jgi:uncharacterized membrane protein YdjX (TVP38/TMEM64 family)
MKHLLRKLVPVLIGLVLFVAVSAYVKQHTEALTSAIQGSSMAWGMTLYVLLGILTVVIPFGSLLPFIPVAVTLWGWHMTAILTFCAWLIGGQLLFELARAYGKPYVAKLIPARQRATIKRMVQDRGIAHALALRFFTHGDLVSYAYGVFTPVSRWEFFVMTAVGVTPGAIIYSYAGALDLRLQVTIATVGIGLLTAYWILEWKHPEWLRKMRLQPLEA